MDGDVEEARRLLIAHGALESTRADALDWAETAKTSLMAAPAGALRNMMADLADYVVARLH